MLKDSDSEIYSAMQKELHRQKYSLELIPSENYVSTEVMEAMGSWLTNKYSEGYPGKRYYGGNEFIDIIETIAIERAKKLFKAEHANVQPYSGSPANQAIYAALVPIGEKVMGMDLAHGGHLTHGSPVNFSGKWYKMITYGVDKETELIDYDLMLKKAREEKPKMIIVGATAYPRKYDFRRIKEICDEVSAYAFADIAHIAGLCVTEIHENPVPYFDVVSTTTHKTLRGPRGAIIMCKTQYAQAIDKAVFPGLQGGPHDHTTAAIAVALKEASLPSFKEYTKQIVKNAQTLAQVLMDYGFRLVSGGTDNHLLLLDLQNKNITGKEAQVLLDSVSITTNMNTIPYDLRKPFNPSGLRLGTPALTSRGMKESEMKEIAGFIHKAIENRNDEEIKRKIKEEVETLCQNFMIY